MRSRKREHHLNIGIGVNSGYVTVGNVGSETHKDYVVIGRNVNLAARLTAKAKSGQILVRLADERKSVHAFHDLIVVSGSEGGQVRLGDIARITDRFDLDEDKILFEGKPAALLSITKTENEDTLEVIDAVRAFIARERATAPPTIRLTLTNDVSSLVRDRLTLVVKKA